MTIARFPATPWYKRPIYVLVWCVLWLLVWLFGRGTRGLPEGSRTHYTQAAIVHVPCLRCGQPSRQEFSIYALDTLHYGVCDRCDVGINRAVLRYVQYPSWRAIIRAYARAKG